MPATQVTPPWSPIRPLVSPPTPLIRAPALWVALVVAGGGALWTLLGASTGTDLTAQQARADFAAAHPGAALDLRWFGGVHPAAYSVLSPYLMAGVGVRLAGALAAVTAAVAVAVLLLRWRARRAAWAAAWSAVVLVLDLVDGRITFAVGLAVGLAALVAVPVAGSRRLRWVLPCALAVGCALTSPVAALFLALVAVGWAASRPAVVALVPAALMPLGLIHLLAPQPGRIPDTWSTAWPDLAAAVAVLLFCRGRSVRVVAALYAVAVVVIYLDPGPIGSNDERLALLFTGPALICCAYLPRALLLVGLVLVAHWTTTVPLRDLHGAPQLAAERTAARHLVSVLGGLGPMTGRVEVVPFRDHGEADIVASSWPLARGWERQLDLVHAAPLYSSRLDAAGFHDWLRQEAVQYVALGRHAHDFGAVQELRLLRRPPAYLVPVHTDPEWTVWRVLGSRPVVSPPGALVTGDAARLRLAMPAAVPVDVAVRWSRWWHVTGGACLSRHGDGLTVRAPRAETVTLTSSYGDPGGGPRCA